MANTRKSAKRAKQAATRRVRNTKVRSSTKTAVRSAVEALKSKDMAAVKVAYLNAVKALGKAASKGSIPKGRASRKISRLTQFLKKTMPQALSQK